MTGLVTSERAKAGVPLGLAPAQPQRERRQCSRLEIAERRDEGECGNHDSGEADERRRSATRATAAERPGDDRRGGPSELGRVST